ncbi:pentapeptide repeat-containing protein [Pseudomonas sp. ICMP 561]|uniref:pentapeptide repeat-containing protein n=1 Tax=Pseudomonas sp. ICMP 561 TaxID=1718918 RepID=UPI000C07B570|nr:pentapeptide repeat-containing protein [Pseudomonas sp. ICMP 561]PHN17153.1 hypothetical protein AO242_20860 [Pseudomonas sp. ICMP 561]
MADEHATESKPILATGLRLNTGEEMNLHPALTTEQLDQLRDRWTTPAGRELVTRLIKIWQADSQGWREVAAEIPETDVEAADPGVLADLRGLAMTNVKLRGAMLPYADLSYASFHLCDMEEIRFQGSKLSEAVFCKCNLKRSDLLQVVADHSILDRCDMDDAVLIDADFRSSWIRGVHLPRAVMDEADLRDSRIEYVVLDDARMLNTQFPVGFDPTSGFGS